MANRSSIFYKGLALFKTRTLYANIRNDRLVRYCTASIRHTNPYRRFAYKRSDPKYPSLVEIDEPNPIKLEPWSNREIAIVSTAAIIAPVLMPIWLLFISTFFSTAKFWRSLNKVKAIVDLEWYKLAHGDIVDDYVEDQEAKICHGTVQASRRKRMLDELNVLEWNRYDAYLPFSNAHASIVVRESRFKKVEDVINHFVDHFDFE